MTIVDESHFKYKRDGCTVWRSPQYSIRLDVLSYLCASVYFAQPQTKSLSHCKMSYQQLIHVLLFHRQHVENGELQSAPHQLVSDKHTSWCALDVPSGQQCTASCACSNDEHSSTMTSHPSVHWRTQPAVHKHKRTRILHIRSYHAITVSTAIINTAVAWTVRACEPLHHYVHSRQHASRCLWWVP